jgi:transposase
MPQQNTLTEPLTQQIGTSTVTLTEKELTISIPRIFWTKKQWNWLFNTVFQLIVSSLAWITAPSMSSSSSTDEGQPRWKLMAIDGISSLLFALLIRPTHPLRKLFNAIDWAAIDERCAVEYKNEKQGAPAYPPQVLFRILVLMFYSGTPFESATLLRLETDVAWRWFSGLNMLVSVPNAGTLSRFRSRVGREVFEEILIELIVTCDKAGLISHEESYYDMTGVQASGTQVTPYQRAVILARALSVYLDKTQGGVGTIDQQQIAAIALEVLQEKHPSLEKVSPEQIVHSQNKIEEKVDNPEQNDSRWWQRITQKIWELKESSKGGSKVTIESLRQTAGELIPVLPQTFGNPDASVGHTRTDGTLCGYRSGFLVDAKRFIITAVVFVNLSIGEASTAITALDKHYALFGRYPKRLGLDSAFDRDEVHRYTEENNIYSGVTIRSRPGAAGVFHADKFVWNEQGQLLCPNGEVMEQGGGPYKNGNVRYRCQRECIHCPLMGKCLTDKQQEKEVPRRELQTNPAAHQRAQRNRERSQSPEGKAIRRQRFAAEGVFGHVNHFHNGDKAPYGDGEMDNIAQIMVAFVSNLEKLATST